MINQNEQDERIWNHALRFEKINNGFCPDCDEKLNDNGLCADCHIVPSLDPEFQEWLRGLFKNIDTPADFDLTDLVISLIEDWIAEGDIGGMTPRQIADEWDNLPAMEVE